MSDTPRTDAFCGQWVPRDKGSAGQQVSDFARKLERELAQAKAAGEALAGIVRAYAKQYTDPRSRNGNRNQAALAQWEKLKKQ